ncbi:MAG: AAA family ATPase, partial [Pseudomonadota bacterium]|nr:AAA family ATPase [Pseudomonadota bacterium]
MLSLNFNPKKTTRLFGLKDEFNYLKRIISSDKFPKTLMLSGNRGVGKSTITSHLMHYYFDKKNYNENENTFTNKSTFFNQFVENLFPNILYLNGSDNRNAKIDDIRSIINNLNKSPINNDKRFIILDDIDSFNINSLNALLKIIEDPGKNNYFILINNKSNKLLDTIRSRSIEIKIMVNNKDRLNISASLIKYFNQDKIFDENLLLSTPGNFLRFNYVFNNYSLDINEKFLKNFK